MSPEKILPPSGQSAKDVAYNLFKGVVGTIPAVGSLSVSVIESIFTAPIEKRRQAWIEEITEVVNNILQANKDLTAEILSQNKEFTDIALHAWTIAMKTGQEEKRSALKNAIFNTCQPTHPEEDLMLMFLRYIDELTPWHLKILGLLNNPTKWAEDKKIQLPSWMSGGPINVIEECFGELRSKKEFCKQLVRDLQRMGLIQQGDFLNMTMTVSGMMSSRTTEIGGRFIEFISE